MTDQARSGWWSVARSEEVMGRTPLGVDIGDQPVVLWRDDQGIVRALEDRCPHRRVPLSMGCVRDNGWLQCGYHGWSFDGASGQLMDIPHLKDNRRFPPLYRASRFAVAESDGFVRVSLAAEAPAPARGELPPLPLAGTVHVTLDHRQYLAALMDEPGLLIGIRNVRFTPYPLLDPAIDGDHIVMERACQWAFTHWPAAFSHDFPITLLSRTHALTGESDLSLRDADMNVLLRIILAPVPAARGITAIRWRAGLGDRRPGLRARLLGLGVPLRVHTNIDAAALRRLPASASQHGDQLRARLLDAAASAAA